VNLTAAHLKEIAKLNPSAHAQIMEFKNRYKLRKIGFRSKPAGYERYLGEGEKISFHAPNGKSTSANMVTESTVGCMPINFNYAVGKYTPPLPEGTWIVSGEWFLGKFCLSVEYIGQIALPE